MFQPKISFLNFLFRLPQRFLPKPTQQFSFKDRQYSGLSQAFQPNVDEMRRVFDEFDADKDGKISKKDYSALLRKLRQQDVECDEVHRIFHVIDLDRDGFIDFDEFMDAHKKGGGVKVIDIRKAFWFFDLDGDGKISPEEVLEVLNRLGESCSLDLEDCKRMVRGVDTDGDGFVDMEEFMNMMTLSMKPN
ncbi:PREDICTED: calmodulin-like protein 1 [Nelumbo nucifera]|uniref:Calmodulin-like protein 1 n=2 Tax=Nelumbo nucifera TaxID=4432 RepID=A0A1U8B1F8_NELNU|nr:PREDICTED: calmodulin-like protein 1 [Nelumbo nucifera]DAD41252.1 TPA_asm: hypothetical protein HUJ06_015575 [Nelumbo nucifera]